MVRVKGLEPPRHKTLEPKSSASANSAIPAIHLHFYYTKFEVKINPETAIFSLNFLLNNLGEIAPKLLTPDLVFQFDLK